MVEGQKLSKFFSILKLSIIDQMAVMQSENWGDDQCHLLMLVFLCFINVCVQKEKRVLQSK